MPKRWTNLEKYALYTVFKTNAEELSVLSDILGRPLEEVKGKYKEICEKDIDEQIKKLMENGLTENQAIIFVIKELFRVGRIDEKLQT